MRQAVLLCGGLGSRLRPLTDSVPKALLSLQGRPLLDYQLTALRSAGVTRVFFNLLLFPQLIIDFVGDGSRWDISVTYAIESEALGTAGALRLFAPLLNKPFFVVYSDVVSTLSLSDLYNAHVAKEADVTLVVRETDHPHDSDLVEVSAQDRVLALYKKPHAEKVSKGILGAAACYVMSPKVTAMLPVFHPADIFTDFLPHLMRNAFTITAYRTNAYMKDVGTIERLRKVEEDIQSSVVSFP